jgi:TonB family protein
MFRIFLAAAIVAIALPTFHTRVLADSPGCKVHAFADAPAIARDSGMTGTTLVAVNLNNDGRVDKANIAKSSGNHWLDEAALQAAAQARFTGDCADGLLIVDFK